MIHNATRYDPKDAGQTLPVEFSMTAVPLNLPMHLRTKITVRCDTCGSGKQFSIDHGVTFGSTEALTWQDKHVHWHWKQFQTDKATAAADSSDQLAVAFG